MYLQSLLIPENNTSVLYILWRGVAALLCLVHGGGEHVL